jgi:hypothetical protein
VKSSGTLDGVAWLDYGTADDEAMMTMRRKVAMPPARWKKVSTGSRHVSEDIRHLRPNTFLWVGRIVIALRRLRMAVVLVLQEAALSLLASSPDDAGSALMILVSHHLQRWLAQ